MTGGTSWYQAFRPILYRHRWGWTLGLLMLVLTNLCTVLIPEVFRQALVHIQQHGLAGPELLYEDAWKIVILALVGGGFRVVSRLAILYTARDIEMEIRCAIYERLMAASSAVFERYSVGDITSRLSADLGQLRLMFGPGVLNIANTMMLYTVTLPMMWRLSPMLFGVIFALYPLVIWWMSILGRHLFQKNIVQSQKLAEITEFVRQRLLAQHMWRDLALQDLAQQRYQVINDAYYESNIVVLWLRSGLFRIVMSLSQVAMVCCLALGGWQVLHQELSLPNMVTMIEYLAVIAWPTFALGWIWSLWQRGQVSAQRLVALLEAQLEEDTGGVQLPMQTPALNIEGLCYRYDVVSAKEGSFEATAVAPAEAAIPPWALDGISLTIAPATFVGICGRIGSGKSTLLKVLLRWLPASKGEIIVNGIVLGDVQLLSWRKLCGYVPQSPLLFSCTIAENIAFGNPQASFAEIEEAAKQASLLEDIALLPEGFNTMVGERGVMLSGGQKQRLALARLFLSKPSLWLLDDALSALDNLTEQRIVRSLLALQNTTIVLVSHRLAVMEKVQTIFVLEEGKLHEQGNHQTLLKNKQIYARMYRQQMLEQYTVNT